MAYDVLVQEAETSITERWVWGSEVITGDDGSEQRISLASLPKRSYVGTFAFDNANDIRRHVNTMFKRFNGAFEWPAWHIGVKLKARAPIGSTTIFCNTSRSDFRPGRKAILKEGSQFEIVTIDTVEADRVTLPVATMNAFSARAKLAPLLVVYSGDNAAFVRRSVNKAATASFTFHEYGFVNPFIIDEEKSVLPLIGDYPLLNRRALGASFDSVFSTGIEITDYGGVPSLRAKWLNGQWAMPLTFKSPRGYEPLDWNFWRTFGDYCRGSTNPFWLPTFRPDFDVFTAAAGGGTQVTLTDTIYSEVYQGKKVFDRIVITRPDGTQHFAQITAVAQVTGRDRLTFTPALPAGNWAGQMISFLLKCRITDDTISTEHNGLTSLVTLNIRTVD